MMTVPTVRISYQCFNFGRFGGHPQEMGAAVFAAEECAHPVAKRVQQRHRMDYAGLTNGISCTPRYATVPSSGFPLRYALTVSAWNTIQRPQVNPRSTGELLKAGMSELYCTVLVIPRIIVPSPGLHTKFHSYNYKGICFFSS